VLDVLAPADWRGRSGDRISIQFDIEQLFVFDSTTGNAIYL
jgi:multiple sugar transport system ATP-binding protein